MAIPDAVDVFGDYSAEVDDLSHVTALVGRIDGNRLTSGIQIQTLPRPRRSCSAAIGRSR